MVFVSAIIGKTVTDVEGETVGKLKDLIVLQRSEIPHPQLTAMASSARPRKP